MSVILTFFLLLTDINKFSAIMMYLSDNLLINSCLLLCGCRGNGSFFYFGIEYDKDDGIKWIGIRNNIN